MKILIVDDVLENRVLLSQLLRSYGECSVATNGKEALTWAREALSEGAPFDLILLDVMMPIMDGLSALQAIRVEERSFGRVGNKESVIIMVTACDAPEVAVKAFFEGYCTDFLTKPVRRRSLLDKLKEYHLLAEAECDHPILATVVNTVPETRGNMRSEFHKKLFERLVNVGVPAFDEAHRNLLNMVVDIDEILGTAIAADLPPDQSEWLAMSEIFAELVTYTKIHFSAELAYLRHHGYPRADQHKERHDEIIVELNEYNRAIIAMDPDSVHQIRRWLLEWLLNHVNQHDHDYSMFFSEQARAETD
ncbi:hemerythrin domain-containing protein [Candidatus Magnetaquicoccus inordinatus]|uniref:hemerythrin domain-containing protein n=1 Tax=Candidatus Magnetaquicoccus inordinatus TaxID=2496818 RepID=UPI00102CA237|nr:hemerythrin domain-containing protein [Candidatus Magnetaquicoccus inordinatus]MBF0184938.1 response regulator [Magnetococcales bacterium]